jgi:MYXO-CTERM domain-containing protein
MNKSFLFTSVAVLGALTATANATLIDFNSLSEGTIVSNQFAGVTFAAGTGGLTIPNPAGTTQGFATNTGMGVTSTDLGGLGTPVLVSGMVLHRFNADWLAEDGDPVFVMTFASNVTSISIDFNGISTIASTGIFAYAGGTQVASSFAAATGGQTLSISGLVGVTQIAVTPGDFGDWVGVDNINYTVSTVPEPASFAVLGLGALALIRRRRNRS